MSDTQSAEPVKRGPGRPPKVKPDEADFEGEDVTYIPGSEDPPVAKWRGHEFKANVPLRITDRDLIASARGNRFFQVGADAPTAASNSPPETAMQYRAHVVAWMKGVETVEDIAKHWAADARLRVACEVGDDDIEWLGRLFEPKLHKMRMTEGLKETDVAAIWVRHGVLQLPWRS